jgi:hypothetical protein
MYLLAEVLLVEVLLVGVLPLMVLLALEREMVLAVSVFLEKKERIPPGLEIPEEEEEWYSLALCLCSGTLGTFSLLLAGLGGIGTFAFGPCRCAGVLIQKERLVSTSLTNIRIRSV